MPQKIIYLLILSLFAPLATGQLFSRGDQPRHEYYRAVKKATVFKRPGINTARIGVLNRNERVRVLTTIGDGSWYKIQLPQGDSGYVRARLLQKEPPPPSFGSPQPEQPVAGGTQPGAPANPVGRSIVARNTVDIHEQPSARSAKLGVLASGTTVTVLDATADGNWYRISLRQGGYGYVPVQLLQAEASQPNPQPEPIGVKLTTADGRCLDIDANGSTGSGGSGRQVIAWRCHGGANQRWIIPGDGAIISYWNGQKWCLEVNARAPVGAGGRGFDVIVWPDCHGGANQSWQIRGDGVIRSNEQGWCLDVNQNDRESKSVIVWPDCHGGANQRWSIER